MLTWQSEYLDALQLRDRHEQTNRVLCDQYRKLADRTAYLGDTIDQTSISPTILEKKLFIEDSNPSGTKAGLAKLLTDLTKAQRSRAILQHDLHNTLEELQRMRTDSELVNRRLRELEKEKTSLSVGLNDRNEELRAKSKLLEEVHDETVSLTLQLNMIDARAQRLEQENKELVDRWMKRVSQEANAINDTSRYS